MFIYIDIQPQGIQLQLHIEREWKGLRPFGAIDRSLGFRASFFAIRRAVSDRQEISEARSRTELILDFLLECRSAYVSGTARFDTYVREKLLWGSGAVCGCVIGYYIRRSD